MSDATAPDRFAPPAPKAAVDVEAPPPNRPRRLGVWALVLLAASMAALALTVAAATQSAPNSAITAGAALATVIAAGGFVAGAVSTVTSRGTTLSLGFRIAIGLGTLANAAMVVVGALLTFLSTVTFSRGRQLRSLGRVLLPRVRSGGDWAGVPIAVAVGDAGLRASVAALWRDNGRTEHASVAAFARLTLDLMALGAPPALVAAANRDALDEIRHTELCFSLARAIDGASQSPGPFPEARAARTLAGSGAFALAQLAVDSLVDGALREGVSARVVAKLAKRCEEPAIRAVLKEIAADEGRHAAHGWGVVEWCLREGGAVVAHALAGALYALPTAMRTPRPEAAAAGAWERYGIVGSRMEADEFAKTREALVRRVEAMIGTCHLASAA